LEAVQRFPRLKPGATDLTPASPALQMRECLGFLGQSLSALLCDEMRDTREVPKRWLSIKATARRLYDVFH